MQEMDTAALEELRALRARAYGPDADIAQDPAAVRRLRELEALSTGSTTRSSIDAPTEMTSTLSSEASVEAVREAAPGRESAVGASAALGAGLRASAKSGSGLGSTPGVSSASGWGSAPGLNLEPSSVSVASGDAVPGTARGIIPGAPSGTGSVGADAAESDPPPRERTAHAGPPRRTGRVSRRIGLMWGLSVVAAAALAAGITYAATSMAPVATSSGAPQIATLEPSPLVEVPAGWFGAGPSSRAFEFYGLTLFESAHGYIGTGSDCFMAVPTEQLPADDADPNNWSMSGPMYSGCRVGDFPATVAVPVDSSMPEELRERFPPGSALQFVLDSDRIGVFLDSP